jgi:hypothetical protein
VEDLGKRSTIREGGERRERETHNWRRGERGEKETQLEK